jgi:hypothetical protein
VWLSIEENLLPIEVTISSKLLFNGTMLVVKKIFGIYFSKNKYLKNLRSPMDDLKEYRNQFIVAEQKAQENFGTDQKSKKSGHSTFTNYAMNFCRVQTK